MALRSYACLFMQMSVVEDARRCDGLVAPPHRADGSPASHATRFYTRLHQQAGLSGGDWCSGKCKNPLKQGGSRYPNALANRRYRPLSHLSLFNGVNSCIYGFRRRPLPKRIAVGRV